MRILALDASLTSSGYAYCIDGEEATGTIRPKDRRGPERLNYLSIEVDKLIFQVCPRLFVIEGYAMGYARGQSRSRPFDIGEGGGVLKLLAYRRKIPILIVPPSNLKLFATGKGQGVDKDAVRIAMGRLSGRLFANSDESDAYALLQLGIAFYDARRRPRLKSHYKNVALCGCTLVASGS